MGPIRKALEPVVVLIVIAIIVREFPAYDEFFQEGVFIGTRRLTFLDCQGHPLGSKLAVVEVRGKIGLPLPGGVVPVPVIVGQSF